MPAFDFSSFPTLITARLVLRPMTPEDAPAWLVLRSDPEVVKYDTDPPTSDITRIRADIDKAIRLFEKKKAIWWAIALKETNKMIGDIVFFFPEKAYYKADLGYGLARAYWRQGYATEAGRAVIQFAFETLGAHRINVDTRIDNPGSIGLMRALGFKHEGTRRECVRSADGTYQSWALFGMLEDEYQK